MESMLLMLAAASAREMAAVYRGMNRHDLAAMCEADAHAIDARRGTLNAEGHALAAAAVIQNRSYRYN